MQYTGNTGVYTYKFEYAQNENCAVCGSSVIPIELNPNDKLQTLIDHLLENTKFQLKKPSLRCNGRNLYMQGMLLAATKDNLEKTFAELEVKDDDEISITDPALPGNLAVKLRVRLIS